MVTFSKLMNKPVGFYEKEFTSDSFKTMSKFFKTVFIDDVVYNSAASAFIIPDIKPVDFWEMLRHNPERLVDYTLHALKAQYIEGTGDFTCVVNTYKNLELVKSCTI